MQKIVWMLIIGSLVWVSYSANVRAGVRPSSPCPDLYKEMETLSYAQAAGLPVAILRRTDGQRFNKMANKAMASGNPKELGAIMGDGFAKYCTPDRTIEQAAKLVLDYMEARY
jgi:hypothetical protein